MRNEILAHTPRAKLQITKLAIAIRMARPTATVTSSGKIADAADVTPYSALDSIGGRRIYYQ